MSRAVDIVDGASTPFPKARGAPFTPVDLKARFGGKIEIDWDIPEAHRDNLPERIDAVLPTARFPPFPFGKDFTRVEQQLLPAMQFLADHAARPAQLAALLARSLRGGQPDEAEFAALERMGLDAPHRVREHSYRALILGPLRSAGQ
ncbi:MAG: hypothetical protein ACK4S5_15570 [Sphingobium yanoikuyae]